MADPDSNAETSTPRWVKVFGIIALVLLLLFAILHLTGLHGDQAPASGATERGGQEP